MIYLYPANKMENLLVLLDKVHQVSPLSVFSKEHIIVQNAGMQHWLNVSLAQRRQLSMNNQFLLPAQFLWQLMRTLACNEKVPEQSPYSREALCWRIYAELTTNSVLEDTRFESVNNYWNKSSFSDDKKALHRYQLACQLADLFEQYLIFRPEWIDAWYKGQQLAGDEEFRKLAAWQGALWLAITKQAPYNPVDMMASATANMVDNRALIPERITFFGINAMAPMWLEFIHQLSQHSQVHFFHLNPCFDYWGDIKTEKQAIDLIQQWSGNGEELTDIVGNSLLANLGQQGREFLALLQQYSTVNIEAYEDFSSQLTNEASMNHSVLQLVQQDILTLHNRQLTGEAHIDESIVFTSAHSALREVQGLHDWLLHQFNNDPLLTPKDVLVMCPQVEEYAPYIQAVFAQGWHDLSNDLPPLPCSISDRISKDSDPIVAIFLELLALPDSRFNVSKIMSWLSTPVIQEKYGFSNDDLDKCRHWLDAACVHWGIDKHQKQQILSTDAASNMYTWQFGFSKLLQGFAYQDVDTLYLDNLLISNVEGNDAVLLGQLMLFIEHIQWYALQLNQPRTPLQWHEFLTELSQQLLTSQSFPDTHLISNVLDNFVEYCHHSEFEQSIGLSVISDFLNNHFSVPDAGSQFLVGQVTFCSMLPMRSIPFKVIALLGLNDGDFPRQRQPFGFDLMAESPSKLGDRSRRGDDKYLFLEAIISARQTLYLSYQGRNIRNNAVREPSLVLKDLMSYLHNGFGWQFSESDKSQNADICIRQLAMQPYSLRNFTGRYMGFDKRWLALGEQTSLKPETYQTEQSEINIPLEQNSLTITLDDLVNFFHDPAKYFAKNRLNLSLDTHDTILEDDEPFAIGFLESYQIADNFLNHQLNQSEEEIGEFINQEKHKALVSGRLPELPNVVEQLDKLASDSENLASVIKSIKGSQFKLCPVSVELAVKLPVKTQNNDTQLTDFAVVINASLPISNESVVYARPTAAKAKDKVKLYLSFLLTQMMANNKDLPLIKSSEGFYFNTKAQKVNYFKVGEVTNAKETLGNLVSHYLLGQISPKPIYAGIAETVLKAKSFEQSQLDNLWYDERSVYSNNRYLQYFWPSSPVLEELMPTLIDLYQPMFSGVQQVKIS